MDKQEAVEQLKQMLKPGNEVFTSVKHVSQSGMSRVIQLFVIRDNQPQDISWLIGKAAGYNLHKKYEGLNVFGGGMDMCFEVVYQLGRVLWPRGFNCAGLGKCHSNDHSNGDRNYKKHLHNDGGYALIQRGF